MSHRVSYGADGASSVEILPDEDLTDEARFALQIILKAAERTDSLNVDRIVVEAYALAQAAFVEGRRRGCINQLPRLDSLNEAPEPPVLSDAQIYPSWRAQAEAEEMPLGAWIAKILNAYCKQRKAAAARTAAKRLATQPRSSGANVVPLNTERV